ncbi:MAG: DinB family protein [Chloroflexi bacterium]|nr:DinB family protein [Chloroflexota bacterium]
MDVQAALREQLTVAHDILEQTIADCSKETLDKNLAGATITSIGSIYAHAVFGEDAIVQGMLQGKPPLYQSQGWAGKLSVPFPTDPAFNPEWGRSAKMEPAPFRDYAKAVYAATDAYVAGLSGGDLERKIETGFAGQQTVAWVTGICANHVATHTGEIAALKGVQGLKGLPF